LSPERQREKVAPHERESDGRILKASARYGEHLGRPVKPAEAIAAARKLQRERSRAAPGIQSPRPNAHAARVEQLLYAVTQPLDRARRQQIVRPGVLPIKRPVSLTSHLSSADL
jgi:hypothetical protein